MTRPSKPIRLEKRQWLNKGTAQGRATVSASYTEGDLTASWTVADCSRQINLDFCVYGCLYSPTEKSKQRFIKEIDEKIAKAQLLMAQLSALETFLMDAKVKFIEVDFPKAVEEEADRKLKEDAKGWVAERKPRLSRLLRNIEKEGF